MVIVGFLATLSVAFLPGLTISWWLPLKSLIQRLIVAFSLSLLVNQYVVLLLVSLGAYHRPIILCWWLVQLALCCIGLWVNRSRFNFSRRWRLHLVPLWSSKQLVQYVALAFAIISGWVIVSRLLAVNPGVFSVWDDLVSFNKWALEWYAGQFPGGTQYYPQLIPANWSMIYQLIGTGEIQFFAKALMALFPILTLLVFVDLWQRLKSSVWLWGLSLTTLLFTTFASSYIGSGYSDIPVAFLALVAFSLLMSGSKDVGQGQPHWPLALAVVVAASLTKQAGLYLIAPLAIGLWFIWKDQGQSITFRTRSILILVTVFLAAIAPWYGYKSISISRGLDTAEFGGLRAAVVRSVGERNILGQIYIATSYVARNLAGHSLKLIYPSYNLPQSATVLPTVPLGVTILLNLAWLILLVVSWREKIARYIIITILIPYYLIWTIGYSYDFRNLIIILPFWGIASGIGLFRLLNPFFESLTNKNKKIRPDSTTPGSHIEFPATTILWAVATIGLVTLIYAQLQYPLSKLHIIHDQMMKQVGFPNLNQQLYSYYQANGLDGKIRSMYQPLNYLPQLKDYSVADGSSLSLTLLHALESDPAFKYVLWWDRTTDPDAGAYINEQLRQKKYLPIFEHGGYYFFKIKP